MALPRRRPPPPVGPLRAALEEALQLGVLFAVLLGFWALVAWRAVELAHEKAPGAIVH